MWKLVNRIANWALIIPLAAGGCASAPDMSGTASMSCAELNGVIAGTSKDISSAAVTRGRIDSYDPPFWLIGATRAKDVLVARGDRKIEETRAVQDRAEAERQARCR